MSLFLSFSVCRVCVFVCMRRMRKMKVMICLFIIIIYILIVFVYLFQHFYFLLCRLILLLLVKIVYSIFFSFVFIEPSLQSEREREKMANSLFAFINVFSLHFDCEYRRVYFWYNWSCLRWDHLCLYVYDIQMYFWSS